MLLQHGLLRPNYILFCHLEKTFDAATNHSEITLSTADLSIPVPIVYQRMKETEHPEKREDVRRDGKHDE